jgi:RHS repeat-associated protein
VKSTADAGKFASGFIGWLKSNFGWLYSPGQTGKARSGLGFVYDEAGNMLAAYSNGSNFSAQQQMEVIWLPKEDGSAIPVGLFKAGQFHAIHTDHLGTPRVITNSANAPLWQWAYSAFGDNKPTGPLQDVSPTGAATATQLRSTQPALQFMLRFPGQYCDDESKLCYNWWRSYMPAEGRYPQFDPERLRAGWNGFQYAITNPLSYSDPDGRVAIPLFAWAAAGAAAAWSGWMSTPAGQQFSHEMSGALSQWMESRSRGRGDPKRPADVNPGRDCDGNCEPCPPNPPGWSHEGDAHGSTGGRHYHRWKYNQDPVTCVCRAGRVSGPNPQ